MSWYLDDVPIARTCQALGIPYGLLVQAASAYRGVEPRNYEAHRAAFAGAARIFFVSDQNREIVERDLALDLARAEIVDNPFRPDIEGQIAWPAVQQCFKLACVARINFDAKGQDLLLQVMRTDKWRSRPLEVTLFGSDEGNLRQVRETIDLHGLGDRMRIGGFSNSIRDVWAEHHALILPSRYEGNPLAMLEAMMCGRMAIVTDVGRASELTDDGVSGFIAAAPTAKLLDDAMERAWAQRHDWQSIGTLASETIRARHSVTPAADFAGKLLA